MDAALKFGFDKVLAYNESVMTEAFRNRYHHILESSRGGGFWMWKPYAILRTLLYEADWGDYVCYVSGRQKLLWGSGLLFHDSLLSIRAG